MAFIRPDRKGNEKEEQRLDAKDAGSVRRFSVPAANARFSAGMGRGQQAPNMQGGDGQMAGGGDFGRYVSLGEYLGQNQQQAQGMANTVGNSAKNAGASAENQIKGLETTYNRNSRLSDKSIYGENARSSPGASIEEANADGYASASRAAQSASTQNANLGSMEGVGTNMKDAYSAKGHSQGEALWDGALTQQAGGGRFAQLSSRYNNIGNLLNAANERSKQAYAGVQARNAAWDAEQEKKRKDAEDAARAAMENDQRKVGIDMPEEPAPSTPTPADPLPDDWIQRFIDSISPDKNKPYKNY